MIPPRNSPVAVLASALILVVGLLTNTEVSSASSATYDMLFLEMRTGGCNGTAAFATPMLTEACLNLGNNLSFKSRCAVPNHGENVMATFNTNDCSDAGVPNAPPCTGTLGGFPVFTCQKADPNKLISVRVGLGPCSETGVFDVAYIVPLYFTAIEGECSRLPSEVTQSYRMVLNADNATTLTIFNSTTCTGQVLRLLSSKLDGGCSTVNTGSMITSTAVPGAFIPRPNAAQCGSASTGSVLSSLVLIASILFTAVSVMGTSIIL